MENNSYSKYNAEVVLEKVEKLISAGKSVSISEVCADLSIFDWWNDRLSTYQMMQMRAFLKEAIKLGYKGYVCFKVGATGTSNGMWAHKAESTDGYSPNNCDIIFRSFSPSYTYWQFKKDSVWYPESGDKEHPYDSLNTPTKLEAFMKSVA